MDRILNNVVFHTSLVETPNFGEGDTCPIDQTPAKPFNVDPMTGRPMSDITAVIRAQGLEKQRMIADLQEYKAEFLPSDMSDEDAVKYLQPRLCQLPSELVEYKSAITKHALEEKARKDEEDKIRALLDEEEERIKAASDSDEVVTKS